MTEQQKPPNPPDPAHQSGTSKGEEKVKEEGKQAGRKDTGTTGEAKRPTGKSTAKDSTGVNPKDPVDPESPHLPTP
jgi:hypothetical protein